MVGSGVRKGLVTGRIETNIIHSGRIGGRNNDGMDDVRKKLHISKR